MSDEISNHPTHLRLVGRSQDGSDLELVDDSGAKYAVRISDTLRATISAPPKSHLSAVVNMQEAPTFTVKDIQARLRAGETIDAIARTTDWSQEKIEKFAGPILQERAYIIELALKAGLRRNGEPTTLEEATSHQLSTHGVDLDEIEWNTHRNIDGSWNLILHYPNNEGATTANWNFSAANRVLTALDDSARWIAGEAKPARTQTPSHGLVYPSTSPAPRLVAVREEITIKHDDVEEHFIKEVEELELEIPDESDPKDDGIVTRPKLPSWDDIMFGGGSNKSEDE